VECSNGHELKGTEKYCPRCGEPQLRCPNGHQLEGGEDFCPECGSPVVMDRTSPPAASSTPFEPRVGTPERAQDVVATNDDVRTSQGTPVICGRCRFEEVVDGTDSEWTCSECSATWYVVICGKCGEVQITSEDNKDQRCIDCQRVLRKTNPYVGDETLGEVEPQLWSFLTEHNVAGVVLGSRAATDEGVIVGASSNRPAPSHAKAPPLRDTEKRAEHKQRPRWRPLTWFILAVNTLFLVWIIAGIHSASENCNGQSGSLGQACHAGTAIGAGIGVGIIVFFWVAVDVILGIIFLVTRRN